MSYSESKKALDAISAKYASAGDIIMRAAAQYMIEYGKYRFTDDEFIVDQISQINARHDAAEKEGRVLLMTREFERAIFDCARELANVNTYDLIIYMQKEMYWSNEGGLDYRRAMELLDLALDWIDNQASESSEFYRVLVDDLNMADDEIMQLGWDYCIPKEKEDEDE